MGTQFSSFLTAVYSLYNEGYDEHRLHRRYTWREEGAYKTWEYPWQDGKDSYYKEIPVSWDGEGPYWNIVLSRKETSFPGTETFSSLEEALHNCSNEEIIYIIGGETLYRTAMPLADILCLTEINDTPVNADAFFPDFNRSDWEIIESEEHGKDEKHDHEYRFVTYIKRKKEL